MSVVGDSTFFRERRADTLPTPAEVRALNEKHNRGKHKINFDRPPPVKIESLGLFIKYGTLVTRAEIEAQMMVYKKLRGRVPVPEVFGWDEDQGQTFLYMALVQGDPLHERWPTMTSDQKSLICADLRIVVKAWRRNLRQYLNSWFIGSVNMQPLTDIFFTYLKKEVVGPFYGTGAVDQFQEALGIDIAGPWQPVFTHNDLAACNILVSKKWPLKVEAVIDWGQAGWYPAYWEYCKAQWVNVPEPRFLNEYEEEWEKEYLPQILDAVDENVWHKFVRFAASRI